MNCPACNGPLNGKILVCAVCWWKVPTKDRIGFGNMWRDRRDTTSKGEKIIRNLKAKR